MALVCKAPCYPTACMLSPFLVRSGRAGSLNRNACIVLHVCVYIGRRAQVTEVTYVQKSERAHGALELLTCLMSEHVRAAVPFAVAVLLHDHDRERVKQCQFVSCSPFHMPHIALRTARLSSICTVCSTCVCTCERAAESAYIFARSSLVPME